MKKSNTSIIVAVLAGAGLLWWLKKRKAANTNNAPANNEENGGNNGGLKPHVTPVIVPGKDTTDLGGKTQYVDDKPGKEGGMTILTPAVITKG